MGRMKMLTKADEKAIPPLYPQEHTPDPLAVVTFFDPTGARTWYVIEGERRFKPVRLSEAR
jgi:hypothetical protein